MVHGQLIPADPSTAIVTNSALGFLVPPVRASEIPGFLLFPSHLFFSDNLYLKVHLVRLSADE